MKEPKGKLFSIHKWASGLIGMLVVFSLTFAIPSGVALADGTTTPAQHPEKTTGTPVPPSQPGRAPVVAVDGSLTNALQNAQTLFNTLKGNLNKTADTVNRLNDIVDHGQATGLDTSALSTALAAYQAQVSTAGSSLATAASLLSNHNGFDSHGSVTDSQAAAQTIQELKQALQDAQDTLNQAASALGSAANDWQTANTGIMNKGALQENFKDEQGGLAPQQANLEKAFELVAMVQKLITGAQARGLDTSDLSTALAAFQARLADARDHHATAVKHLSAFAGFDGLGNVTDRDSAAQTIQVAGQGLNAANDILRQAIQDLLKAVKDWEAVNINSNNNHNQGQNLGQAYQKAQDQLSAQTTNLEKAEDAIDRIQALIDHAQNKGQNTSALQHALKTYQSQLTKAEAYITTASNILSTHTGFDDDGNVTDRAGAAQTVKDANQALTDASGLLSQAVSDLQKAFQSWHR